jgi:hypothetical protein
MRARALMVEDHVLFAEAVRPHLEAAPSDEWSRYHSCNSAAILR